MQYQIYNAILDEYGGPILFEMFGLLLVLEYRHSLRRWVQGIFGRIITNTVVSVPAAEGVLAAAG